MSVHVDEMTSEVQVERGAPGAEEREPGRATSPWDEEDRYLALRQRIARDQDRLAADGFDD